MLTARIKAEGKVANGNCLAMITLYAQPGRHVRYIKNGKTALNVGSV